MKQEFMSNGLSFDTLNIDMGIILEETKVLKMQSTELLCKALSQKERMELKMEQYYYGAVN